MANNRLAIQCTGCNEYIIIAKHWGGSWKLATGPYMSYTNYTKTIQDFLDDHFITCGHHCLRLADEMGELDAGEYATSEYDVAAIRNAKTWQDKE